MSAAGVSPAVARNTAPILAVLAGVLPPSGLLLEVASGTGEHAVAIARAHPGLRVQPSDPDPAAIASIEAWQAEARLPNLVPPLVLDAAAEDWPIDTADAIVCINMVHISPWAATEGLIRGAARLLPQGGLLYLYGPFLRDGVATAESNLAFNQSLKARHPQWGLRRLEEVAALAAEHGLGLDAVIPMPANNLSVLFRRESPVSSG